MKYVDICSTLEVLNQDSGLLPKPKENWNTFEPHKNMVAYVVEDNSEYRFSGTQWKKIEKKEDEEK